MSSGPPNIFQHLRAILLLPFVVTVVIPAVILWPLPKSLALSEVLLSDVVRFLFGALFLLLGLALLISTIRLFVKLGRGTLAPWNPTQKLVVQGIYRYTRNPMISGVLFILIGESLVFQSWRIAVWALFFFLVNHFYFLLKEEPDLVKRFGEDYKNYQKNVPRWIPKLKFWTGNSRQK